MTGAFSIHMQISELQAELRVRRERYPVDVRYGRMRTSEAETKIACMDAALATLMRARAEPTPEQRASQLRMLESLANGKPAPTADLDNLPESMTGLGALLAALIGALDEEASKEVLAVLLATKPQLVTDAVDGAL